MLTRVHFINTFSLIGILIASWLLYQWLFISTKLPMQANQADAFIVNMVSIRMSDTGALKEQLSSPLMVHYPLNNTTHITTPHLVFFNQANNPWHLYAEKGKAHNGTQIIDLWDKVRIERAGNTQNIFTRMTTSTLTIYPKDEIAQTQSAVTIEQPGSIVKAIGMRANLKTDTIDLLSQVRGNHAKIPK